MSETGAGSLDILDPRRPSEPRRVMHCDRRRWARAHTSAARGRRHFELRSALRSPAAAVAARGPRNGTSTK